MQLLALTSAKGRFCLRSEKGSNSFALDEITFLMCLEVVVESLFVC